MEGCVAWGLGRRSWRKGKGAAREERVGEWGLHEVDAGCGRSGCFGGHDEVDDWCWQGIEFCIS